jgi:hypothetical protein
MDITTFFILLFLALGASLLISKPFFEKFAPPMLENQQRADLQAEYERLLSGLQELDFDNSLGKIPADVYSEQRKSLLQAAAEIMKTLEKSVEKTQ